MPTDTERLDKLDEIIRARDYIEIGMVGRGVDDAYMLDDDLKQGDCIRELIDAMTIKTALDDLMDETEEGGGEHE